MDLERRGEVDISSVPTGLVIAFVFFAGFGFGAMLIGLVVFVVILARPSMAFGQRIIKLPQRNGEKRG